MSEANGDPRILSLNDISREDVEKVGGKGANLGELTRLGLPVPRGFCVPTSVYAAHVRAWGLADALRAPIAAQDWQTVERTAADVCHNGELDSSFVEQLLHAYKAMGSPSVAVRSSATAEDLADASFAGQQETFLNVDGDEELLAALRGCWASLWGARASHYRHQRGIDHLQVNIAVVVQEMVAADAAGVVFSVDPTAQRADRMLVQAAPGLGEAVVSGSVTGDTYRVERDARSAVSVVDRDLEHPGHAVLTDTNILEIARIALQLESHFGTPQDVEFALANGHVYLLQARPITTLDLAEPEPIPDLGRQSHLQRAIAEMAQERYPVAPKPLDQLFYSVELASMFHALRHAGFAFPPAEEAASKAQIWREAYSVPNPRPTRRLLGGPKLLIDGLNRDLQGWWDGQPRDSLRAISRPVDLASLTDATLFERSDAIVEVWRDTMSERFARLIGVVTEVWLRALVTAAVGPRETARVMADLLAGVPTVTFDINDALWKLARQASADPELAAAVKKGDFGLLRTTDAGRQLLADFDAFIEQYGNREGTTWYLSTPTWRRDPSQVWRLLQALVGVAAPPPQTGAARFEAASKLVARRLRLVPFAPRAFRWLVERLRAQQAMRENSHFDLSLPLAALQDIAAEWGKRLAARGLLSDSEDVFYLTYDEIRALLLRTFAGRVADADEQRRARDLIARRRATYRIVNGRWQARQFAAVAATNNRLRGLGSSPGVVRAKARIVRSEQEFDRLQPGEVLVCPYTNPAWTPLFASAAAVVTETGGAAAHAAIVAREYAIPCVMGVPGATRLIADGQELLVDGTKGEVVLGSAA